MNKLIIATLFPSTVTALLKIYRLVDGLPHIGDREQLEVVYPDDAISQELAFWLDIAKACGLIDDYKFMTRSMLLKLEAKL